SPGARAWPSRSGRRCRPSPSRGSAGCCRSRCDPPTANWSTPIGTAWVGRHAVPDERGTAVLLLPVCMLILVALASLTFDASHAFLAQRDLANAVASAANDAAAA